jgi:hypothetical protein
VRGGQLDPTVLSPLLSPLLSDPTSQPGEEIWFIKGRALVSR